MPTIRNPRRGSLQYWPRKRAQRETARVRSWAKGDAKLLGFPGYKVGMTQVDFVDTRKNSLTAKELVTMPCTIIECPPVKILSARFYHQNPTNLVLAKEIFNPNAMSKEISRTITPPKKSPSSLPDSASDFDVLRVNVCTQPKLTGIGKKKPEIFELSIGGKIDDALQYVKDHWDKEIAVSEIFKEGQLLDSHAVTKGQGFQGTVKRYGVKVRAAKAEKTKRGNVLTSEGAAKVTFTSNLPGRMGYHLRTENNKWLVKIAQEQLKPIKNYGVVKNSYLLIKGSIAGPRKRMITFTEPIRPRAKLAVQVPALKTVHGVEA